ncbi:signal peptide protein [Rhodopirellula sallentina SM41]|uniref:Signal peptide protein n=1 Tax=Rhodopirellula sallentina SM41 TaxID=1263870 RepID=M5UEZ4_9BACT|nr:signal peptide protein [Rhodopirellula sallentina SM41]
MDFSGRYGPVDTAAIGRLIEVHQTPVLKGVNTTHLTSARAVDAYLQFAQQRLVNSTAGGPLAAEATMILADLETLAANAGRTIDSPPEFSALHSSELALTYRRAAVEISPDNADAAADLGRTLLKRSIPEAAKDLLLQSVRVAPTRQRFESLLEAAAKSGDFVLVDQCEKQLASNQLPSELPVKMMSPQEFARTGQTGPPAAMASAVNANPGPNQFNRSQQYRVATRPTNNQVRGDRVPMSQPSTAGQIVDPTLPHNWTPKPSASAPPTQPERRLFW